MSYSLMPQEEKAKFLEQAVINCSDEEIKKIYGELGYVEMAAPALGSACRYRGLETVKTLTEAGATFDFPSTKETEEKYRCYIGEKYDNYRTNYSLYLLKVFRGEMKGACSTKGMTFLKKAAKQEGKPLMFLSDEERIKVLDFLYENKEKLCFSPEEMLYYSVFAGDETIYARLKERGVKFSEKRVNAAANGGSYTDGYWYEFIKMVGGLSDDTYVPAMKKIALELDGKLLHFTEKVYELTKSRFSDIKIFEFFMDNFKKDKMNKSHIIRELITVNNIEALPIIEKEGWLNVPKKRDEYIKFASDGNFTEALSWLLDFKNRTADFAAEREKEEKKMLSELNAAPDSVKILQKTWSFKKWEEIAEKAKADNDLSDESIPLHKELAGTLVITNYKGVGQFEVTVPGKIGKRTVTAIGNGAFAGASGIGAGSVITNFTHEQMQARRQITKLTLPKTLKIIGRGAFTFLKSLKSLNIPEGVEEIEGFAFDECDSLTEITVPGTVKKIGNYAFAGCDNLRSVRICEGVFEIGAGAFSKDINLKEIWLPKSLKRLVSEQLRYFTVEALDKSLNLTVHCPKDSYAESYCKQHNIRFVYSSEDK